MTGGALEYDHNDGVRLFSRWRCRSAAYPLPYVIPRPRRALASTASSRSARHGTGNPRRPSVAAPLESASRGGAGVAAAAAAAAAADGLC